MKKKGKKTWIIIGAVAVVVVVLFLALPMLMPRKMATAAYKTHTVAKEDFKVSIQGTGNIVSSNTQNIILKLSGEVQNLTIKDGDRVDAGQTLFTLYNETLEEQIESAEDNIKQQNISASKLKNQLSNYRFYAPIDGYVYNLKAAVGDDAASIAKAHGSICQVVPNDNIELVCTTSFAPLNVEHRGININQIVYIVKRFDPNSKPTEARIKSVSGNTFTVEAPAEYASVGTLTDVYFKNIITIYYKIGEGTTKFIEPVAVTGSGKISKIHVSENQQVKKGDLMFEFDATDVQKSLQSAGITIDGLKQTLEENRADFENNTVTAPISGIVSGLTVSEGTNAASGQTIAKVVDTSAQEIVIQVDELDIPKVKLGQEAIITVDALPNAEYKGTVTKIAEIGTVANSITTFDVTITVADTTGIKIGMSATAEIMVEQRAGIVTVPVDYIENFGDKKRVRVIPKGVDLKDPKTWKTTGKQDIPVPFEWREVTIGSANATETEILSGLAEGDVIAILDEGANNDNAMMFGGPPRAATPANRGNNTERPSNSGGDAEQTRQGG